MASSERPRVVAATSPYPWPWRADLDAGRLALVITGAQPALADVIAGVGEVLDGLGAAAKVVRDAGGLVVWVRHVRAACFLDVDVLGMPTVGAVDPEDLVVDAGGIDGFHASRLDDLLRAAGRDLLVLGGLGLETTVHSTLRSANDRGYECLTLVDGAAPHDPLLVGPALSSICMSGGIFGAVGSISDLVEALGGDQPGASTPSEEEQR